MAKDDLKIENAFDMFTPIDLVGTVQPDLGGALERLDGPNPFKALLGIIENNGRGVRTTDGIATKIEELKQKNLGGIDLSKFLTIWTTKNVVNVGAQSENDKKAANKEGKLESLSNLKDVIGADFKLDENQRASVILSTSPFFNPTTRNTKKAEVFLNSMPNTVLAQLVPYMQIEFQFIRDPSEKLQTLSQLKLLLGAVDGLNGANAVMREGHQATTKIGDDPSVGERELDFAGMEVFTSPATLTNPRPNTDVGVGGNRYVDVLDPFRPFATLEHVTITSNPSGAGYFCYKKANLSLKIHDRSRLHEISDILRPRVYTGVTIWMTYGWRAPSKGANNPYFAYVNNNMMMREAYGIVNSNFSFDNFGQVTVNLELFTKGVIEIRNMKIAEHVGTSSGDFQKIKRLIEDISRYRQKLRLDPPEGGSKEIRVFQILDSAETGEFPDMKAGEANAKIDALYNKLSKISGIDQAALNGLRDAMKDLYAPDKAGKFSLKERYESTVKSDVDKLFREVRTGPDPFLPGPDKGTGDEISAICDKYNKAPATKTNVAQKEVVSFGKLFTVFALRSLLSFPETIDEVQVFFYNMNEQCGPISSHSVAQFPINMAQFMDQFGEMTKQKGGGKITLEDFLGLVINSQFLDKRAIGYGLADYYAPYERGKEAALKSGKNVEGDFESQVAAYSVQYGPFKQPTIEMYIECSHKMVDEEGESDILQMLSYSAKDATMAGIPKMKSNGATKILRMHVYDKQTSAYQAAGRLVRNEANDGFISIPATNTALEKSVKPESLLDTVKLISGINAEVKNGNFRFTSDFVNNQQIKHVVSKLVPTIRFGSNGSTITHANLSSKAEPLLSAVQMMRSQTIKNTAQPNGAGSASGLPLRVIPAQLTMTTLGNPLATMAQQYFIDFQTGTTLDNLYIVTALTHNFAPGKFDTQWTFGYADGYGVFEGAPGIVDQAKQIAEQSVPKSPTGK